MPKTIGPTEWSRGCPECNQTIYYSGRHPLKAAKSRGSRCPSCSNKGKNNGMYGRTGETNPFYGKNHTETVKQAMSIQTKDWYQGLSDDQKGVMLKNLELGRVNETPRLSNYEYNVLKHGREGQTDDTQHSGKNYLRGWPERGILCSADPLPKGQVWGGPAGTWAYTSDLYENLAL